MIWNSLCILIIVGVLLSSAQAISSCLKHTRGCSAHLQCRLEELGAEIQKIPYDTSTGLSSNSKDQRTRIVDLSSELWNLRQTVSYVVNVTGKIRDEIGHLNIILDKGIKRSGTVRTFQSQDFYQECPIPRSCQEILWKAKRHRNSVDTGMFTIKPSPSSEQFQVLCDMRTEGGGWVVIQNRYGGSENFNRSWDEYKRGFGKPPGEFWLGLEYVHAMTGFGWWFNKNCTASNLNGNYPKEGDTKNNGVFWEEFRGMDNRLNITSIRLRAKVPRIH
ncbi:unnamed protein product [Callosobruchus maculatus]|uniref:Fibrinogen C-terminal domain-containing protein n=1 Tax=Callosobruchus maculatus TaxID=64391 RepID=A0A653BH12_CALMS|nr:unnamed protein product [Callosobruchus maculatus]